MGAALIDNVSDTAFWIAHYRGLEGERADALFHDPLAALLAGERGKAIARSMPGSYFTAWSVALRTRIIDDFIRLAIGEGAGAVLNLGAGLDTRPYRMDLPSTLQWIEVDYPDVIAFKEARLASERPRCQLTRLPLDLTQREKRKELLRDVNARASKLLVLTEGVVPYLSEDEVGTLAEELRSLDHAAYWIVAYISPEAIKRRPRRLQNKMRNAPFKFAPQDWFGFFEQHAWQVREMRYFSDEADRLKRPLELPLWRGLLWGFWSLFKSKQWRAGFRRFAGFALLAPG